MVRKKAEVFSIWLPSGELAMPDSDQWIPEDPGNYEVQDVPLCPRCLITLSAGSILCLECGWNLEKGKHEKTIVCLPDFSWDPGSTWLLRTEWTLRLQGPEVTWLKKQKWFLGIRQRRQVYPLCHYRTVRRVGTILDEEGYGPLYWSLRLEGKRIGTLWVDVGYDEKLAIEIIDRMQKGTDIRESEPEQ